MNNFQLQIKNEIISRLSKNFKLKNIILFGSHAYGTPHKDSDIDIIVVLDEEGYAKNYMEKIDRRMKVSKLLFDLAKKFPVDLLVYTKDEWNHLLRINSSFVRQIKQKGLRLL